MIFRWRGGVASHVTHWDEPGNWVDEDGTAYSGGRYPGSLAGVNDHVSLDAPTDNAIIGGDYSANVKLASFTVGALYNNTIGSSATYLKFEADKVTIDGQAAGAIYLDGSGTVGLGQLLVLAALNKIYIKGKSTAPSFLKGEIECAGEIATSLNIGYLENADTDVTLVLGAGMTLPAAINASGGAVTCSTGIAELSISAGAWTQAAGDITTLRTTGGTFYHDAGDITTAIVLGGKFDASQTQVDRRIADLYLYPAGEADLNDGVGNVHITNCLYHLGGTLSVPPDSRLAPFFDETFAGASDAAQGIFPQTVNNTTVVGSGVCLSQFDRLDIYCCAGAIAAGGALVFQVYQGTTSAFSTEQTVSGKTVSFTDADDDKTKRITVWGYELLNTNRWVRVKAANAYAFDAVAAAVMVKKSGA